MELEMMYPEIIGYALLASFLLLFVWRKKSNYKKGVVVANTQFIKNLKYYKSIMIKYRIYNIFIKTICILLIFAFAVLTARIFSTKEHKEEIYNRDIMLCLDVSGSVWELDKEIITTFVDIVDNLKDERFGLSVFNASPINVIPLTTDYNYSTSMLKEISKNMEEGDVSSSSAIFIGSAAGSRGTSLVGTGLAYCANTFKKNDDRTKIIIFATDNELAGTDIISLEEAANYSKENDIKVYTIGTKTIKPNEKIGMQNVAKITNAEYYDYSSFSVKDIVNKIENLNASSITKTAYVTKTDFPELIIFPYIIYLLPLLFLLEWRVKIWKSFLMI